MVLFCIDSFPQLAADYTDHSARSAGSSGERKAARVATSEAIAPESKTASSKRQTEMLMSEKNFLRLFPAEEGYRMFLLDVPNREQITEVSTVLEDRLSDFG